MKYVYGPVPSRRLGQSLGVDPIPHKTCNYNCVYCQLGRTKPLTNTRRDYFPPEDILAEVRAALAACPPAELDYITFVGQGEPLLCTSIGWLIGEIKKLTAAPLAVITNGALLYLPEVRAALRDAAVVMPTLDAADEATFRRVNRPWGKLHIAEIIAGMADFRDMYAGQLWVEVMLVKGLNDTEEALSGIAAALRRIRPHQIHLNVPIRPPAEAWVEPPSDAGFVRALALLGEVAPICTFAAGTFTLAADMPLADAIVEIIRRHPMQETEIIKTLHRAAPDKVQETLAALETSGAARRVEYRGQAFWQYAGAQARG